MCGLLGICGDSLIICVWFTCGGSLGICVCGLLGICGDSLIICVWFTYGGLLGICVWLTGDLW